MAEGRRFELLETCASAVFKTAPLDRSGTPPDLLKHTGRRQGAQARAAGALDSRRMAILSGLVPVFLIIAFGVAARRFGLVNGLAAGGLNRLVANLALPAFLIIEIGTASLEVSFSSRVAIVTAVASLHVTAFALLAAHLLRLPATQRGVLAQAAARGNYAYVGFPVVLAALGQAGLQRAAVTAALLIPLMNLVAISVLELYRKRHEAAGRLMLRVVVNPLVISALLGLALSAAGWRPWGWLAATLRVLADFALPAALLALGAQLEIRRWHGVWRQTATATGLKLVVLPLLGWWALVGLGASAAEIGVGVLLLATPTAIASYPVAAELGGDLDLAGACVLVTTAAAFVAFALWGLVLGL